MQGIIRWFDEGKGVGYILHDGGKPIFVDHSASRSMGTPTLAAGQSVMFNFDPESSGWQATSVVPVLSEYSKLDQTRERR